MGTKPQRLDTPRVGLEDQLAGIFGNALSAAAAPRPDVSKMGKGSAPSPAPGMAAFGGNLANSMGNPMNQAGGQTVGPGGFGAPGSPTSFGGGSPTGGPATGGGGMPMYNPTIQDIYTSLSLPGYGGQLTAGTNPLLQGAFGAGQSALGNIPGYNDLAGSVTSGLRGFGGAPIGPQSALSLLGNLPGGNVLGQLAGGGGAVGELMNLGRGGGAVGQLLQQGGQSDRDFGGILDALNAARRGSLSDAQRDIQERFSASGLRHSTNLADSLGESALRSEESFLGLGAQLLPQLTAQRQGALGLAGQLQSGALGQAGQLGLGAGDVLQRGGLGAADILGQLYQGQQGRALQGLLGIPGAADTLGRLGLDTARQGLMFGGAQRAMEQEGLTNLYNEFLRTQGGFLSPILNFAAGAPQITAPGKGSQLLNAGTQLGSTALGGWLGGQG